MTRYCPACGDEVVEPIGAPDCDFLIVEEFPELILPEPAMTWKKKEEWTVKKILASELAKVGMIPAQFRIVSSYPHLPPANGQPNENCWDVGLGWAVDEIPSKSGIIILGGNLCRTFTGYELKQVHGLSEVESEYIPNDIPRVFMDNIRTIYSKNSGEISLALRRFVSQL